MSTPTPRTDAVWTTCEHTPSAYNMRGVSIALETELTAALATIDKHLLELDAAYDNINKNVETIAARDKTIAELREQVQEHCTHDEHDHGICLYCAKDINDDLQAAAEHRADCMEDR